MIIIISLILLGILLMLIEMLLIPGVGVAGILSLASLGTSCWYSFVKVDTRTGIITTVVVTLLLVTMVLIILRAGTWKRFELKTEIDSKVNTERETVKAGDRGITTTRLAPIGSARIGNVVCEVCSADNSMTASGTMVEVVSVEDNKIFVKPISE